MAEALLAREIGSLKRFDNDMKWFQDHYPQLKRKFKGQYVAVKDKAVIDHDKDATMLMTRVKRQQGDITSLVVEYLSDKPIEYILHGPSSF